MDRSEIICLLITSLFIILEDHHHVVCQKVMNMHTHTNVKKSTCSLMIFILQGIIEYIIILVAGIRD
jgi:hypothetical protein